MNSFIGVGTFISPDAFFAFRRECMRKFVLLILALMLHLHAWGVEADDSTSHLPDSVVIEVQNPEAPLRVVGDAISECDLPHYPFEIGGKTDEKQTLCFNPKVTTFVRDAEYFLPYTKGYSALGFFLKPTFTYNHDERLSASAGLHLLGIAGDHKKLREVSPIVRIEYKPTKSIRIVGGTLSDECIGHGLYQPMYDYDRLFYANKEDGLQVFAYTKHWYSEMWCNWEDFIVIDSPWQEKFTFGWVNSLKFVKPDRRFFIPIHLVMNHRGGQIDAVQDTCIETLANVAIGLEYLRQVNPDCSVGASLPVFGFSNRSNDQHIHTHFKKGWGVYPQLIFRNYWVKNRYVAKKRCDHYVCAKVGYWYGDGFISGRGSYLFQSRSYFDDSFERRYRHMLTAEALYDLNNIMDFRFQAYYDLDESSVDYAVTFALRFDRSFKLHSWANKK